LLKSVLNLNFGVISEESIRSFKIEKESNVIKQFRKLWTGEIEDNLYFCEIQTSSTASKIEIIFADLTISKN